MNTVLENINLVKIIVLLTFVFALVKLNIANTNHRIVFAILLINCSTEVTTTLLKSFHYPFAKVSLLNIIVENCLWLYLLGKISGKRKVAAVLIVAYSVFSLLNYVVIQGPDNFNYYTFMSGAFLYLVFFFVESFNQLEKENFSFIFSNNYVLLCAPLMYLFGGSFMFAFVSGAVTKVILFNRPLFSIVIDYVIIVYYMLLNFYLYKELKTKNE
jgi:hypothetical protein